MTITVLGSGSWGTALAVLLGKKRYQVRLWGLPEESAAIRRDGENRRYLPGVALPPTVCATADLDHALAACEMVVLAIPSAGVRDVTARLSGRITGEVLLVHQTGSRCVALSGPNLAVELANDVPTATVVASSDVDRAAMAQEVFSAPSLRVYRNSDIVGVELGGALKNVLAIGAGISDGLGYGDNTKATVVTRGLVEMTRLGLALGADARTFTGLSGFGDLMATCASGLSRNLRLGRMLGQGKTPEESLAALGQVAEGMPTCRAAYLLSRRHDVYMPITEQIHQVLFQGKAPREAVHDLMSRDHKEE